MSRVLNEILVPAGGAPARVEEVQLTEAIVELVRAGFGVAVLARWAVKPIVASGRLVARPLTSRGLHCRWSVVMRKDLCANRLRTCVHRSARRARAGREVPGTGRRVPHCRAPASKVTEGRRRLPCRGGRLLCRSAGHTNGRTISGAAIAAAFQHVFPVVVNDDLRPVDAENHSGR